MPDAVNVSIVLWNNEHYLLEIMDDQKPYFRITDISNWEKDSQFSPYPEGSRSKYAVTCPEDVDADYLIPNHRYLFKRSNSNFPEQFWAEIIAYVVGQYMGVEVPLAVPCVNSDGECAALIEWFYGPELPSKTPARGPRHSRTVRWLFRWFFDSGDVANSSEAIRYVPGSNYMVRMITGYDLDKGKQHNARSIFQLCDLLETGWGLSGGIKHWAQVFTFDALIGNTDRHQDNWGLLWHGGDGRNAIAEFAPAFDNGTALGHEILEENLTRFENSASLNRYVLRGSHHVRWRLNDPKRCPHIELIRKMIDSKIIPKDEIMSVLSFNMADLEADIGHLCSIELPVPFTDKRRAFVVKLLNERYRRIREMLNGKAK